MGHPTRPFLHPAPPAGPPPPIPRQQQVHFGGLVGHALFPPTPFSQSATHPRLPTGHAVSSLTERAAKHLFRLRDTQAREILLGSRTPNPPARDAAADSPPSLPQQGTKAGPAPHAHRGTHDDDGGSKATTRKWSSAGPCRLRADTRGPRLPRVAIPQCLGGLAQAPQASGHLGARPTRGGRGRAGSASVVPGQPRDDHETTAGPSVREQQHPAVQQPPSQHPGHHRVGNCGAVAHGHHGWRRDWV